jgi:hypothetical protein
MFTAASSSHPQALSSIWNLRKHDTITNCASTAYCHYPTLSVGYQRCGPPVRRLCNCCHCGSFYTLGGTVQYYSVRPAITTNSVHFKYKNLVTACVGRNRPSPSNTAQQKLQTRINANVSVRNVNEIPFYRRCMIWLYSKIKFNSTYPD